MTLKDYTDVAEVKAYLTEAEKVRQNLMKKLNKARLKAETHIGAYDETDDSKLDTTATAARKTAKVLLDLDEAFTALEIHVHTTMDVSEDHLATDEPDRSLVVAENVIGELRSAQKETQKHSQALETLAARVTEEVERQKTNRARVHAERHPETAPRSNSSAVWKTPPSIFNPGELSTDANLSEMTTWMVKLKSYIRREDVERLGDEYFQSAMYNLMTDGVRAAIKLDLQTTIPIYRSTRTQTSIVDLITAEWKITHSPEILESEWYSASMMEGEAFASWDARMVTLAGNAELLKSYGGDQNTFDEKLGRRLLAGLTGEDGRAIYERVMWAQDNGEGQGHHILPLIRRIARTQATIKTRTKHLRAQAATAATVYKLHGGANPGGTSNTDPTNRKCYNCDKEGHIQTACPEPKGPDKHPKGLWMQHLTDQNLFLRCAKSHDKMCDYSGYICKFCKTPGHLEDACQKKHKDFKKSD